jgi:uncharacterized membrane protein YoaK (UPF0700 family)
MQVRDFGRTALLCVIGGSADAVSYLRHDTFVGAMTGNTVLLGIDLAGLRFDHAAYHAGIIAVFFAAIVATLAALKASLPASLPLVFTAIMLGGSELIAGQWSAAVAAGALGMQNAAIRKIGGVSINTAFVTGDLLRLGSAVTEASAPDQQVTLTVLAIAWTAYAAGAIIGAVALHAIAHPMVVPAVLALIAAGVELAPGGRGQR